MELINHKEYYLIFNKLIKEAEDLGYTVRPTTGRTEISLRSKEIRMRYYEKTLENLYAFCHELGHAMEEDDNERYTTSKRYRVFSEIRAWVYGMKFVFKYKLPKIKYIIESKKHIKTYLDRKW